MSVPTPLDIPDTALLGVVFVVCVNISAKAEKSFFSCTVFVCVLPEARRVSPFNLETSRKKDQCVLVIYEYISVNIL